MTSCGTAAGMLARLQNRTASNEYLHSIAHGNEISFQEIVLIDKVNFRYIHVSFNVIPQTREQTDRLLLQETSTVNYNNKNNSNDEKQPRRRVCSSLSPVEQDEHFYMQRTRTSSLTNRTTRTRKESKNQQRTNLRTPIQMTSYAEEKNISAPDQEKGRTVPYQGIGYF